MRQRKNKKIKKIDALKPLFPCVDLAIVKNSERWLLREMVSPWIITATRGRALPDDDVGVFEVGPNIFFLCCCEARRSPLCVLACVGAEVALVLCAGPGPSDTASTTGKPWEASSRRSETSTWSTTSGVRCEIAKCAAMRMIAPGRLQFRVCRLAGENCPLCLWKDTAGTDTQKRVGSLGNGRDRGQHNGD